MAKITFTLNEIFQITKKNEILPKQIKSIYSENNNIKLKIKPVRFSPTLTINLEFQNYKNGVISLKLSSSFIAKQIKKYFKRLNEIDWIELYDSHILIFVNKIIQNYIIGIEIDNLYFDNNSIIVKIKNVT